MENLQEVLLAPEVLWFFFGLVLLAIELFGLSLIVGFFGLGAWITSIVLMITEISFTKQLWIFIISSVLLLALLRKFIKNQFFDGKLQGEENSDELKDEFIGNKVTVERDITPNTPGKVSFKGSLWTAYSDTAIKAGSLAEITAIKSTQLTVKPLN